MNLGDLDLFKEVLTGGVYDESAWSLIEEERVSRARRWLPQWRQAVLHSEMLRKWLEGRGIALVRTRPFDRAKRDAGRDWPLCGYTMIGRKRLDHLQHCIETVIAENLPGDVVETGVWRGGACMLAKAVLDARGAHERCVWLADSFRGLPSPKNATDGQDLSGMPYLAVTAEQVRHNFARFGLLDERVRLIEGWFGETLPTAPIRRIAVLRLDGDLYHSTADALNALYDRVTPGGFVVADDFLTWPGCRRAVVDFLRDRGEEPRIETIDHTAVFWRKGFR